MPELFSFPPRSQREPLRILTDVPLSTTYSGDSSSSSKLSISPSVTAPSVGSPQYLFCVQCTHDFESPDPVHLPFHKGEVLMIMKQERSGWWAAMRPQGDYIGWIPSSFVVPLDRCKIMDYPDETIWPHAIHSNDAPLSVVHGPWVPMSDEDDKALSFQFVTPTDLVLFFRDTVRNHNDGSLLNLSYIYRERSSDGDPRTPSSSSPH